MKRIFLKDKLPFWLWAKIIERRIKDNPLGSFAFTMQKELVYKKIFKEDGFKGVLQEHEKYVNKLCQKVKKIKESKWPLPN